MNSIYVKGRRYKMSDISPDSYSAMAHLLHQANTNLRESMRLLDRMCTLYRELLQVAFGDEGYTQEWQGAEDVLNEVITWLDANDINKIQNTVVE